MRYYPIKVRWQMFVVVAILTTIGTLLPGSISFATSESFCQFYARDYARRYAAKLPRTVSQSFVKSTLHDRAFEHCMRDEWP